MTKTHDDEARVPTPVPGAARDWWEIVTSGSEMGKLLAEFPWHTTSLGPPVSWSVALRGAVTMCLTTRFPMLIVWGPDLIKIYNDGYREILGSDKHPRALGAPVKEIWPEIWHTIGPLFDHVLSTGSSTWMEHQRLVIERNGFPEECFFTYAYSPIFDDDGTIAGVLDTVTETTDQIVNQRRLVALSAITKAVVRSASIPDVCVDSMTELGAWRQDVPNAELYLRAGDELTLISTSRRSGLGQLADESALRRVVEQRAAQLIGSPVRYYAVPVGDPACIDGVIAFELSRERPFDQSYASFLELVASSVHAGLDNAYRRAAELGEERQINEALQSAMLAPASDFPTVAARYLPAVGTLAVGGDWYDVIQLGEGKRALIVGDVVGHGLEAATAMGQLRSASRALLLDGRGPASMLEGLDQFAAVTPGAMCATVACVVADLRTHEVTYATAGHLPPLVVRAGDASTEWLDDIRGTPLAVGDERRQEASRPLRTGDLLVLFTDGLVERRDELIDVGLERLRGSAVSNLGRPVNDIADALLEELLEEHTADDVALVVKLVPSEPVPDPRSRP